MSSPRTTTSYVERRRPDDLADLAEVIVDKGMVIDGFARISPLGTEILFVDGRIVMGSTDSYLHFAESADRFLSGADRLLASDA